MPVHLADLGKPAAAYAELQAQYYQAVADWHAKLEQQNTAWHSKLKEANAKLKKANAEIYRLKIKTNNMIDMRDNMEEQFDRLCKHIGQFCGVTSLSHDNLERQQRQPQGLDGQQRQPQGLESQQHQPQGLEQLEGQRQLQGLERQQHQPQGLECLDGQRQLQGLERQQHQPQGLERLDGQNLDGKWQKQPPSTIDQTAWEGCNQEHCGGSGGGENEEHKLLLKYATGLVQEQKQARAAGGSSSSSDDYGVEENDGIDEDWTEDEDERPHKRQKQPPSTIDQTAREGRDSFDLNCTQPAVPPDDGDDLVPPDGSRDGHLVPSLPRQQLPQGQPPRDNFTPQLEIPDDRKLRKKMKNQLKALEPDHAWLQRHHSKFAYLLLTHQNQKMDHTQVAFLCNCNFCVSHPGQAYMTLFSKQHVSCDELGFVHNDTNFSVLKRNYADKLKRLRKHLREKGSEDERQWPEFLWYTTHSQESAQQIAESVAASAASRKRTKDRMPRSDEEEGGDEEHYGGGEPLDNCDLVPPGNGNLIRITDEDGSTTRLPSKSQLTNGRTVGTSLTQNCFVCRKYPPQNSTQYQQTQWQCNKCGMPLCKTDRSKGDYRRTMSCVDEHVAACAGTAIYCNASKPFKKGKRFPKDEQVVYVGHSAQRNTV